MGYGSGKAIRRLWDIIEFGFAAWAIADIVLDMLQAKTYWEFSVQERN